MSISNKRRKVSRLDTCSSSKIDRYVANFRFRNCPRWSRDPEKRTRWWLRCFSPLAQGTTSRDPREEVCWHFAGFCGTTISHPARYRCLSPVGSNLLKMKIQDAHFHWRTYQLEDKILLIEMPQFVSGSSLRSIRVTGPCGLRPARLTLVNWCYAQEGRRAVDCVDDRLKKTPPLKLVRWNFAHGCRRSWAAGTTSTGGRVASRSMGRAWKLHAAAGRRSRRRVWH